MRFNLQARAILRKATAVIGLMTTIHTGCAPTPAGYERYRPNSTTARAAVVAVLDAWRDGRSLDEGVGDHQEIHIVDKQRGPGQRLTRYEILGEVSAETARAFAIRVTLEHPAERKVIRLHVLGVAPIWVFRQEDLELISHWMHPMNGADGAVTASEPSELSP